jgi:surfactin synthase thioesterase subunit
MLPGDHFFIHRFQPQILRLIGSTLEQAIPGNKDG